jgi:chlorobactene glucosyltransferase
MSRESATRRGMLSAMLVAYTVAAILALITAGWVVILVINRKNIRRMPRLTAADAANFPSDGPLVSILVPARNEEHRILAHAIASMARQDYPNLEIVVVDDRSTDRTFEILERIAEVEPRVRVVRGQELPSGWIGKPWALEQAKRAARGSWILATDADIIFAPAAVRAGLSKAFRRRLDAISIVPDVIGDSLMTRVVLPVASWMIAMVFPVMRTNDPESSVALGCGAFILMRREAHDASGGYEAIRSEIADDVATARALKSAKRRFRLEGGLDLLRTPMYTSLGELWQGFTKNAFAGADHRLSVVLRNVLVDLLVAVAPPVLAIAGFALWLGSGAEAALPIAVASLAAYAAMVVAFVPVYGALGQPRLLALLAPIGHLVMVLILANSTYKHVSGQGVTWKGQQVRSQLSAE